MLKLALYVICCGQCGHVVLNCIISGGLDPDDDTVE